MSDRNVNYNSKARSAVILTLALVMLSTFAACSRSPAGKWKLDRVENGHSFGVVDRFELFKDGTGDMQGAKIEWKWVGKNRMSISAFGAAQTHDTALSGSTFTIIYDKDTGHKAIYKRVK